MMDWVSTIAAAACGLLLLVLASGALLTLPVFLGLCVQVFARRDGVPLAYNLRSLLRRKVTTAVTLSAIAVVAFSLHGALMMAEGMAAVFTKGDPLLVRVLRKGTGAEALSYVRPEQVRRVKSLPLSLSQQHAPIVSPELVTLTLAKRTSEAGTEGGMASLSVRGVSEEAFDARPSVEIKGRRFVAGQPEIMLGQALVGRFAGAHIGDTMDFSGSAWKVVGVIDHGGTPEDSEVWTSYEQLSAAMRRGHTAIAVRVGKPSGVDALVRAVGEDPALAELEAISDVQYWGARATKDVNLVKLLGSTLAGIFSLGAVVGMTNTMYSQVLLRRRELGTLRALGFKARSILVSLGLESAVLGALGGACGVLLSLLALAGREFSLTNEQTQSEIVYAFTLTPGAAFTCIAVATAMGYVGGLLPSVRAARLPIAVAVRG